jgi:hypothetical protein
MLRFGEESFEELAAEVGFCLDNIRHPDCVIKHAGRFYERAAECLRAHAILRVLFDAKPEKFSNDLVMSGQARRGYLRRCRADGFSDHYGARARTGSLLDALAAGDFELATDIAQLSPDRFQAGDEYEDDFCYQLFLGSCAAGEPAASRTAVLARFGAVLGNASPTRFEVCRAIDARSANDFAEAFEALLRERKAEVAKDGAVKEDLVAAIGAQIFVEGVALLKVARREGIAVHDEYPACPQMILELNEPTRPLTDEFAQP